MSPGGHLVTTTVTCAAVYGLTGSPWLTAGAAAGGFLIDVDHGFDYVVFDGQRDLRPPAFLRYYLEGKAKRVVLFLHSYELVVALALVAWVTNWELLWGYLFGVALHLPLDIVFNGKLQPRGSVAFYSIAYRWRFGFQASNLMGPIAPASPHFWAAFFKGAVVRGSPSTIGRVGQSDERARGLRQAEAAEIPG